MKRKKSPNHYSLRLPTCPVTGGCETRMSEASFARACQQHRAKKAFIFTCNSNGVQVISPCHQCPGAPAGLTLI